MSETPQILFEHLTPDQANFIVESTKDGKTCWLNGIFMMAETKNRNNRIYRVDEVASSVADANARIKESSGLLGELDHPENRLSTALDRVSHVITEMWMEGNNAHGKAKLIDTPMGNIAKEIIKAGVKLGVSSRGTGSVNESGYVSAFNLSTIDIVAVPSAHNAYPQTVYESVQEASNGKQIITLAEHVQQDKAAQKYFESEILKFLNELNPRKK